MADVKKTVEIIFGAVDNTGSALSSVANNIESATNNISSITAPLAKVSENALKAEAAITGLAAVLLTVSTNESAKFSTKIAEIGTLVNNTAEENLKLAESVQVIGKDIGSSNLDEFNNALYIATSNVGKTSAALDIMAVAEKGAIVGATGLDNSAALLTRTMNAYGLVTEDSATNTANAERVMAAMFATVQNGDTTMTALSGSIGRVASTAAGANISIETVGAAIAALTGAGNTTDESMTLLNATIKELLKPSKELDAALGGLSITSSGLPAIMDRLKAATGGSSDKFYELFSSSEAAKGALILANDNAGKFKNTLDAMPNAIDNLNSNYKTMADQLNIQTQKMKNSWDIMLQTVGKPNEQNALEFEKSITNLFNVLTNSVKSGKFEEFYKLIDTFTNYLVGKIDKVATNLPQALNRVDFSGFIQSLKSAGLEIDGLFGGVDISTPEGLAKAIQFIVDSMESLVNITKGTIEAWGPFIKTIFAGIDGFNKLDAGTKETIGYLSGLSGVFETLKGIILSGTDALDAIGKSLQAIVGIKAGEGILKLLTVSGGGFNIANMTAAGVALGLVGFALKENYSAYKDYAAIQDSINESSKSLGERQTYISDNLKKISETTGITVNSMDELNAAMKAGKIVMDETTGVYSAAESKLRDYDAEINAASADNFDFADAVNKVAKTLGLSNEATDEASKGFKSLGDAQAYANEKFASSNNVVISYANGLYTVKDNAFGVAESQSKLAEKTNEASKAAVEGSKEWKTVQDVMLATKKEADDFKVSMAEIANKEYEINVKAAVDLQVAQIQADTARIVSIVDATAQTIGDLIGGTTDLWGIFADKDLGLSKESEIKKAADRMEDRLDRELALKEELAKVIIEQSQATTERLTSGQPLIQIDGSRFEPEITMIFDKILEVTQIKTTNEGLNVLLGLPTI